MSELKPCPYRVHGERSASLTVEGEYYYNEWFMPCMEKKCACFHIDCGEAYCDRNGAYRKLGNLKEADDDKECHNPEGACAHYVAHKEETYCEGCKFWY